MAHHGSSYASSIHQFLTGPSVPQADSLDRKFERPLRHHLDGYKTVVSVSIVSDLAATNLDTKVVQERSSSYERALKEKSHIIRQTELSNMNKRSRSTRPLR